MAQQAKKKAARQTRRSEKTADGSAVAGRTGTGNSGVSNSGAGNSGPDASEAASARLDELEAERDEALHKLAKAERRITQLEENQDQVVNRIDWVIDSLHNLKQDTP